MQSLLTTPSQLFWHHWPMKQLDVESGAFKKSISTLKGKVHKKDFEFWLIPGLELHRATEAMAPVAPGLALGGP